MAKKQSVKRTVIPVPKNLDEAVDFVGQIGKAQRTIKKIQTKLDDRIEELKIRATTKVQEYEETIIQLFEGLFIFAETHRHQLTEDGKRKTVPLPTGELSWRFTPPSVSLHKVATVMAEIRKLGLSQFIRTKEEPNKEAMLKEPDLAKKVKGVTISQHEEFVVKPTELKLEVVSRTDKLKKVVSQTKNKKVA